MKKLFDYDCVVQGDKPNTKSGQATKTGATAQKEAK